MDVTIRSIKIDKAGLNTVISVEGIVNPRKDVLSNRRTMLVIIIKMPKWVTTVAYHQNKLDPEK
jgi:hypothetical protein